MKNLIVTVLFLLTAFSSFSQDELTYESVDKETYNLYLQKEWKQLILLATQAKEQDISFYYLDYRMGIAYYELKNYRKAIAYFKEVLSQFPADNLGLEYLFYSYLGSGYYEDARALWLSFSPEMQNQIPFYNNQLIINGVDVEYTNFLFSDYEQQTGYLDVLEQKIYQSSNYYGLGLSHYSNGAFSLFHSVGFLSIKNKVYDQEYSDNAFDESIKQTEYYALGNIHLTEGSDLKIGVHFLNDNVVGSGQELVTGGSGWGGGSSLIQRTYYFYNSVNLLAFAGYEKSISKFNFKISSSVSNLNKEFQFQPSLALSFYPFGNTHFYWKAEAFYHLNSLDGSLKNSFVNKQTLNLTIANRITFNSFLLYGKVRNFVDNNGFTAYNSLDFMKSSFGGSINLRLGKKTYLYSVYQYHTRENEVQLNSQIKLVTYNTQTILGGISWNF